MDGCNRPGARCGYLRFHFHCFHDQYGLALADGVSNPNQHLEDIARQGRWHSFTSSQTGAGAAAAAGAAGCTLASWPLSATSTVNDLPFTRTS